ncbi:MAG: DUF4296 domain-containing protein [Paludibacter sp.]|nr:DUF4296 domain-containing protein [Paludibacter sp.]MDD4198204.1 DUF4296 domain-containing protein [Paludibacter sp.]MDD4427325.1 DUF4296 domain-containing protein [Paludibacter sp.]
MLKKGTNCLLFCILLFQFACSNRPDEVMSRREMRSFLTDLHLLEGVFSSNGTIDEREKAYYYNALFLKHGITKAEFDSSLAYYTKNPKMFERIYTDVNKDLEKLDLDVADGKYFPVLPDSIRLKPEQANIWNLDTTFSFPKDSTRHNLYFSIKNTELLTKDIYSFSFRMRAFPHDSLDAGYSVFRIHYANGQVDSLWHEVLNDSVLRRYKFRCKAARNFKIDSLSGVFYTNPNGPDTYRINIDSVVLFRRYVPAFQDSLRLQLDSLPPKGTKPDTLSVKEKDLQEKSASPTEQKARQKIRKNS